MEEDKSARVDGKMILVKLNERWWMKRGKFEEFLDEKMLD